MAKAPKVAAPKPKFVAIYNRRGYTPYAGTGQTAEAAIKVLREQSHRSDNVPLDMIEIYEVARVGKISYEVNWTPPAATAA